jgi:hypothetical protein
MSERHRSRWNREWIAPLRVFGWSAGALLFAVTVLFAGYFIGKSAGFFDAQANDYVEARQLERSRSVSDCVAQNSTPPKTAACIEKSVRDERESRRAEADLAAQRSMADWAWWLLIVTMIQTPVTAAGVLLLLRNIQQSDAANEIARSAMTAENRAWVEVDPTIRFERLRFQGEEIRLKVTFELKNVGNTVALNVSPFAKLICEPTIGAGGAERVEEMRLRLLEQPRKLLAINLFPGRTRRQEWDTSILIEEARLRAGDEECNLFPIALCVGAQYSTIFDQDSDSPHQTLEILSIRKIDAAGLPLVVVGTDDVPEQQLTLYHLPESLGGVS